VHPKRTLCGMILLGIYRRKLAI